MLEEWAWDADVLRELRDRRRRATPIPADLVAPDARRRRVRQGAPGRARRCSTPRCPTGSTSERPADLTAGVRELHGALQPDRAAARAPTSTPAFGHLDGYSSAYYTYMWSLVIAKDLFSAFDPDDLFDPEVARRYRDPVLAPGGSQGRRRPGRGLPRPALRRPRRSRPGSRPEPAQACEPFPAPRPGRQHAHDRARRTPRGRRLARRAVGRPGDPRAGRSRAPGCGRSTARSTWVPPRTRPTALRVLLGERDGRAALRGARRPRRGARGARRVGGAARVVLPLLAAGPVDGGAAACFHAIGLAEWHCATRYCPRCGDRLESRAGRARAALRRLRQGRSSRAPTRP